MPLLDAFRENVAAAFGIAVTDVEVTADAIRIGADQVSSPPHLDVQALLTDATVLEAPAPDYVRVSYGGAEYCYYALESHRPTLVHGIAELAQGATSFLLFTGSLGETREDFSPCDSQTVQTQFGSHLAIIGLAAFRSIMRPEGPRWADLLEAWGPLAWSTVPLDSHSLARFGFFGRTQSSYIPSYLDLFQGAQPFARAVETTTEALDVYSYAIRSCDGPDVGFLRFYRVLEAEFAITFKKQVGSSDANQVLDLIRSWTKGKELIMVDETVRRSLISFSHFSRDDFNALYPSIGRGQGQHPLDGNYQLVQQWLDSNAALPSDACRGRLIYFVRNSLVHSKLDGDEQILCGPFPNRQYEALGNLIADLQAVVESLLFI